MRSGDGWSIQDKGGVLCTKSLLRIYLSPSIGAIIGGGGVLAYNSSYLAQGKLNIMTQTIPNTSQSLDSQIKLSETRNTAVVRAAQAVGPAVVGITNKAYSRDFYNRKVLIEKGTGSGVIFDANGYIATNNHVVENAQELLVSLADGRVLAGRVLGVDPATDLAVVKVEASGLAVAALGDSDNLMVGEPSHFYRQSIRTGV